MLLLFIGKIHLQIVVTSRHVTYHLVTTSYIFLKPMYNMSPAIAMNARLSV
jgi:hypothetical protein